jgi:DNA-binding NarL/FixJ family response regulator
MARDRVKVLLADECPATLRGLEDLMASVPSAEVVGGAASRKEASRLAEELRPDAVFLDPGFMRGRRYRCGTAGFPR